MNEDIAQSVNVFGQPLGLCCSSPTTGYYRDGYCNTGSSDYGTHVVCSVMTQDFLEFSIAKEFNFANKVFKSVFPAIISIKVYLS